MGGPIPDDIDGKVLTSAINNNYLASNPVGYSKSDLSVDQKEGIEGFSSTEEEMVKDELKGLGYFE